MAPEDIENRLRATERDIAVLGESMKGIHQTLQDIKQQICAFLDKAQLALAVEGRVERLEESVTDLFNRSNAAFKLIDQHKAEFARMQTEHEFCQRRETVTSSWWKDRAGRIVDAALVGIALWLLLLWKNN